MHLELNIALIPEESVGVVQVALSQKLASNFPTIVQLSGPGNKLNLVPHLTLYQAPLRTDALPAMDKALAAIAAKQHKQQLVATGYAYNEGEGSLEVSYATTDQLVNLQEELIAAINTLRGGLYLERDPPGNIVRNLLQSPGRLAENIRRTGYAEVGDPRIGGLLRPHVTLNWFKPGTPLQYNERITVFSR
ncbi:MAG TPA: hypothetical protein VLH38_01900 [Patescibacteria group bacterium]|nr:hypothetical protein [Patescibacteria group bacterium]